MTSNQTRQTLSRRLKNNRIYLLMLSPALVYFLIFNYIPMSGLVLAFKKYNHQGGIWGSPWIGLKNFRFLFVSGAIGRIILNTVFYNIIFLVTCQFISLVVAVILNEIRSPFYKNLIQSLMFLPYFVSFVVVGAIVYNFFNYEFGLVNNLLISAGLKKLNVYGMPNVWWLTLASLNTWKWVGYTSIIYLAAAAGINPQLYEAARIDGANIWTRVKVVTIPALKPTVITIILFQLGSILKGQFELFYNVVGNNSQLFEATDVIDTYVFRMLVYNFDVGMGTAAGLFQSFFGLLLICVTNYFVKRYRRDYALF